MSKPSEGIKLAPVKWSELVKKEPVPLPLAAVPAPAAPPSKYVPPSQRSTEAKKEKELTAGDLDSAKLFPSLQNSATNVLPPMLPMTSGASWTQIRNRIEGGMKEHIVEKIEEQKQSLEEKIRIENEEDPYKMTVAQREARGWKTLYLSGKSRPINIVDGYFFTEEVPLWDGCPFSAPPEILGYK
jgi:hypothetical protein